MLCMCSPWLLQNRSRARYTGMLQNSLVSARGGVGTSSQNRAKNRANEGGLFSEALPFSLDFQRPNAACGCNGMGANLFALSRIHSDIKKTVSSFLGCGIPPQLPTDIGLGFLVAGRVSQMSSKTTEVAIEEIIAACDGDMRGALEALLLVNEHLETELNQLHTLVARLGQPCCGFTMH